MGISVAVDESVEQALNALYGKCAVQYGLLIGHVSEKKHHVVAIVPTPMEQAPATPLHVNDLSSIKVHVGALRDKWVAVHAEQVTAMLPGGLGVVGVYMFCPAGVDIAPAKLSQCVLAVGTATREKTLGVDQWDEKGVRQRIMLHVCASTRKVTCKSVDAGDIKAAAAPAVWAYQQGIAGKFHTISATLDLRLSAYVPADTKAADLEGTVLGLLQPTFAAMRNAVVAIDGRVPSDDEPLEREKEGKKGKGQQSGETTHTAEVYMEGSLTAARSGSLKAMLSITGGRVCVRAYVPPRSSAEEAARAVRMDIARSTLARFTSLLEGLQDQYGQNEGSDLTKDVTFNNVSAPQRVFAPLVGTALPLCDYLFADEGADSVTDNIRTVFSLEVKEGDLEIAEGAVDGAKESVTLAKGGASSAKQAVGATAKATGSSSASTTAPAPATTASSSAAATTAAKPATSNSTAMIAAGVAGVAALTGLLMQLFLSSSDERNA